jgi:DNA-binding protein H-NS
MSRLFNKILTYQSMSTYAEIQKQIAELQKKAEQLRSQERNDAIADVKAKIKTYGITAVELGFPGGARKSGKSSVKVVKVVKFRDANGNTWSGGRGRKPQWILDAMAAGKDLSQFAV